MLTGIPLVRSVIAACVAVGGAALCARTAAAGEAGPDPAGAGLLRLRGVVLSPAGSYAGGSVSGGGYGEISGELYLAPAWSAEIALAAPADVHTTQYDLHASPQTLTVKRSFGAADTARVYVGVGVDYTALSLVDVQRYRGIQVSGGSFGWVSQTGLDVSMGPHWAVNADLRYLGDLRTNATQGNLHVRPDTLNPFLIGGGISYRFGR